MSVTVYQPTGRLPQGGKALAARLPSLAGARIGILHNGKAPGDRLLEEVRRRLVADGAAVGGHYLKRKSGAAGDTDRLAQLAAVSDAVVNALAD